MYVGKDMIFLNWIEVILGITKLSTTFPADDLPGGQQMRSATYVVSLSIIPPQNKSSKVKLWLTKPRECIFSTKPKEEIKTQARCFLVAVSP